MGKLVDRNLEGSTSGFAMRLTVICALSIMAVTSSRAQQTGHQPQAAPEHRPAPEMQADQSAAAQPAGLQPILNPDGTMTIRLSEEVAQTPEMQERIKEWQAQGIPIEIGTNGASPELPEYFELGPTVGMMGGRAKIDVPNGFIFIGPDHAAAIMEAFGNPSSGREVGILMPEDDNDSWFVVFEFDDCGYVKDDEKDSLDADAVLEALNQGNEAANREREQRGWGRINLIGWEVAPRYDEITNNLEWAVLAESEGQKLINYNCRLLGRRGVMEATLVTDPSQMQTHLTIFRHLIGGFEYQDGQKYAEFRQGDKIAKYGLTGLMIGGAGALAIKSGLIKYLWKGLVIGVVAFGALFKSLFRGRN